MAHTENIANGNYNLGPGVREPEKKSGKEQQKSVNDHEQQTNLLRAEFVDMH